MNLVTRHALLAHERSLRVRSSKKEKASKHMRLFCFPLFAIFNVGIFFSIPFSLHCNDVHRKKKRKTGNWKNPNGNKIRNVYGYPFAFLFCFCFGFLDIIHRVQRRCVCRKNIKTRRKHLK